MFLIVKCFQNHFVSVTFAVIPLINKHTNQSRYITSLVEVMFLRYRTYFTYFYGNFTVLVWYPFYLQNKICIVHTGTTVLTDERKWRHLSRVARVCAGRARIHDHVKELATRTQLHHGGIIGPQSRPSTALANDAQHPDCIYNTETRAV